MKVQRLVIFFNHYDFDQEGVAAKSFGGNVELKGPLGDMNVRLRPEVVTEVLDMVAAEIEGAARAVGGSVSANAIKKQAHGNLLEHQQELLAPNGVPQGFPYG